MALSAVLCEPKTSPTTWSVREGGTFWEDLSKRWHGHVSGNCIERHSMQAASPYPLDM